MTALGTRLPIQAVRASIVIGGQSGRHLLAASFTAVTYSGLILNRLHSAHAGCAWRSVRCSHTPRAMRTSCVVTGSPNAVTARRADERAGLDHELSERTATGAGQRARRRITSRRSHRRSETSLQSIPATFRILYALIVLGHDRRKVIHFDVTQIRHKSGFAPNDRGLSLGHRAPLSAAGPGCIVWFGLPRSSSGDGHERGCYRAAVTMAESVCRAPHRLDPPRRLGSHHHLQRASLAARPLRVFSISSLDNTSVTRQGLSAASPHTASLCRRHHRVPGGGRPASSLRTSRRLISEVNETTRRIAGKFIFSDPRATLVQWGEYPLSWVEVLMVGAAMMAMAEQQKVSPPGIDNTIEAILMAAVAGVQVLLFALGAAEGQIPRHLQQH